MVSFKTLFGYLSYALLTAVLFMVLLFPDQAINAYVNGRLGAIDPLLTMQAETIRPAMPPGLKMIGVDLTHDRVRLAHFDHARMSPELTSLLRDEKQVRFEARLAGGSIDGRAVMADTDPAGLLRAEADLSRIRLDQLDAVKAIDRFTLSGTIEGHLTHDGGRAPAGVTSGVLNVSELHITLKTPVFGIADLIMDQTDAEFSINGRSLRLKALNFGGPMVEGKITGSIELRQPFGKSRLNLTGNVKPQPELVARLQQTITPGVADTRMMGTRGLIFRVRGSVDNPDVSMR